MSSTSCTTATTPPPYSVDHTTTLSDHLSHLHLQPDHADVHLIVEGTPHPAHKIILAARSDYFRALLYGGLRESAQAEIELKDATEASFVVLLKYVYSGRMGLGELSEETVLEVLGLSHQWGFTDLESSICDHLQSSLHVGNVCAVLDAGLVFGLTDLVRTCAVFADTNAAALLEHPSFMQLSAAGLTALLTRDSFYSPEEKIFDCVCAWVKVNGESAVLHHVRLPLMDLNTLLERVRPTGLVSPEMILDAIQAQAKARDADLKYRGYLIPEENVAHVKHGAAVLKGEMRQAILDGDISNYDVERGFTRHTIEEGGEGGGGIVIRLRQQCILNHVRMLLWDRDLRSYSYYIDVSMDGEDWVRVVDHSKYHCRSWQSLYFPQRVVKYIKIVGTHNTVNRMFHVVAVQAFYTRRDFTIDPRWGLVVPRENVATQELSAFVIEGVSRSRNTLINGEVRGYDWDSGYTCHQLGSGAIIVQLPQPYLINTIKLLLWDCDDRHYSYYVEVSSNQKNWEMVANRAREKCKSWQTLVFEPVPVVYVRIVGTDNSANEVFHCVHFECSFAPAAATPSSADKSENPPSGGATHPPCLKSEEEVTTGVEEEEEREC